MEAFIRALKHQISLKNLSKNVLVLLSMDEIGYDEYSPFNPLQTTHYLFENPEIAIVAMSNWEFDDACFMNKFQVLSRFEPNENELINTVVGIQKGYYINPLDFKSENEKITRIYFETRKLYSIKYSKFQNFHELTDFYAMVKFISNKFMNVKKENVAKIICEGFLRNFSGKKLYLDILIDIIKENINNVSENDFNITFEELVCRNIEESSRNFLTRQTSNDYK